ncbi:hypothetical protein J3R30DRAFT_3407574 [Lentinula aciculospora]|uniref:Uncharacterized protein n=1 Tax=Lentinula aciculospora TaxID=153920 RepID=A0A9W9A191_9AGAR|nr:hypothetical protein J3R30DRAFT_3407574 [Lentinula aciculospora]
MPVQQMSNMFAYYLEHQQVAMESKSQQETEGDMEVDDIQAGPSSTPFFVRSELQELTTTSASFLVDHGPMKSILKPPIFQPAKLSPRKSTSRYTNLIKRPSEGRDAARKEDLIVVQAGAVISNLYAMRTNKQMQGSEEKAKNRGKGKKRLMGDGKAKLKKRNDRIKDGNEGKKVEYNKAVTAWEAERDRAKAEKRRAQWIKPMWRGGYQPENLLPRPKKTAADADADNDGDEEESEDDEDDSER